jgi:hypothetical protein
MHGEHNVKENHIHGMKILCIRQRLFFGAQCLEKRIVGPLSFEVTGRGTFSTSAAITRYDILCIFEKIKKKLFTATGCVLYGTPYTHSPACT